MSGAAGDVVIRGRPGFSLAELLVALVITTVIVSAMIGVFLSQSRLFGQQESQRSARSVSRNAANAMLVDLRMVEPTGGVEAASAAAVTLRVPYAVGVVCATSASDASVTLLPVDSVLFELPGYSGYAWRGEDGEYTYVTGTQTQPEVSSVADAACADESVATLPSGSAVRLEPGVSAALGAGAGTAVLLYRRILYEFAATPDLGGDTGLLRTALDGGSATLLAGPFAAGSRFRFFIDGVAEPQEAAPADLSTIRGLQFDLQGVGNRPAAPGQPPADAPLNTAIFFNNAPD